MDETDSTGFAYDGPQTDRRASAGGFLLDAVRHRRSGRMLLSGLVMVLFLSGTGLFAYPFFTDVYTEQVIQDRLAGEFERIELDTFEQWEQTVKGNQGAALTRIAIPAIGVETLVVEGTSPSALRAGAGHYPNTPLPGQNGNVAIAGHRTTYGRPFNRIDELSAGDHIWLSTPVGDHRYEVAQAPPEWDANPYVTHPKDWQVIAPSGEALLTLTTCHPKGSAAERLVVRARLVESKPAGTYAKLRNAGELQAAA